MADRLYTETDIILQRLLNEFSRQTRAFSRVEYCAWKDGQSLGSDPEKMGSYKNVPISNCEMLEVMHTDPVLDVFKKVAMAAL